MPILPEQIVTAVQTEIVLTDFFDLTIQMKVFVVCIGAAICAWSMRFTIRCLVDTWDYIFAGREGRARIRSEKRSGSWLARILP